MRVEVIESSLTAAQNAITEVLGAAALEAEKAMAWKFWDITLGNFGFAGLDRPTPWVPLSPAYAKKVGRTFATLYVTGRLYEWVNVDEAERRVAVSNADVPYATVHQYGGGNNIPARPYFPIDENGNLTPYTAEEVRRAAADALQKELSR